MIKIRSGTVLRNHPKIVKWSDSFAVSFTGLDQIALTPSEWFVAGRGNIRRDREELLALQLPVYSRFGQYTNKSIRSSDRSFLESLSHEIEENYINKSWEELGYSLIPIWDQR